MLCILLEWLKDHFILPSKSIMINYMLLIRTIAWTAGPWKMVNTSQDNSLQAQITDIMRLIKISMIKIGSHSPWFIDQTKLHQIVLIMRVLKSIVLTKLLISMREEAYLNGLHLFIQSQSKWKIYSTLILTWI